ncbi:MAG: EAL domain-containing protein [Pseudomonadota bacterium]
MSRRSSSLAGAASGPPLNVLLVDDDAADRRYVSRCLEKTGLSLRLEKHLDTMTVKDLARSGEVDCILLDYRLPEGDAFELYEDLLEESCNERAGLVLLTGHGDERLAAEAIQRGFQEYLSKAELNPAALRRVLEGAVEKARLNRQLKKREEELRKLSFYDAMTQLPNRQLFLDRLANQIRHARRDGEAFAVLMMDLNGFKQVNDSYGHQVGDALLIDAAHRLAAAVRESDTVARFGGDEFTALLPMVGGQRGARRVCRKILESFEVPFLLGGGEIAEVGMSIGMAIYPQHGEDPDVLLRHADVAMYESKRSHRQMVLYEARQGEERINARTLARDLKRALEEDQSQLRLAYQPQVCLETGLLTGAEALVRWHHPVLGEVPPVEFVQAAEQCALIEPLTLFVLERALAQARTWAALDISLDLSLNLSAGVLSNPMLMDRIIDGILESTVEPSTICFEVTETGIMRCPALACEALRALSELGCQISVDDFGTGYSSLKYLRDFPINEIKIDRLFVGGLLRKKADAIIVESVLALGQAFDVRVVAEGIEDPETLDRLRGLGCRLGQGYHIAQPMPRNEFETWRQAHLRQGPFPARRGFRVSPDGSRFPRSTPADAAQGSVPPSNKIH